MAPTSTGAPLDRARYLRVVFFLGWLFAHVLWWDVVVRRVLPLPVAALTADRRWRGQAARYRLLAVDLGGLLIKLGQFLSARVDVLPRSVTTELAGLQDEVPPVPFDEVKWVIEAEFGAPCDTVFAWVDPEPVGAASLAQVHRARTTGGEEVVVKVQRPRIDTLVETDLAAFRFGTRLLRRIGWIRRRADLDRLYDEFARTSRLELDFEAEGRHAETFAEQFAEDGRVQVPRVHWAETRRRVLTLEDVTGIKVTDVASLDTAGVAPSAVARALVDLYLRQIFVNNFVHADPHPGNLFVHPATESAAGQAAEGDGRGFRIAFVDFGMVAVVPERLRGHLRDIIVGMATRDAGRVVRAYHDAGVLLPGADLARIEQATAAAMDRFWDVPMGDMQERAMREAGAMLAEYGDIVRDMPFQLPADLLFVGRAASLVSGLATDLDPDLNFWDEMAPFAKRLASGEAEPPQWAARLGPLSEPLETLALLAASIAPQAQSLLALPVELRRLVTAATTGQLTVQWEPSPQARRDERRRAQALRGVAWSIVFAALFVGGVVLRVAEPDSVASSVVLAAAAVALLLAALRR
ncbi:MAG: ABC1 kinase family protein [Anaerolineae bacterium]